MRAAICGLLYDPVDRLSCYRDSRMTLPVLALVVVVGLALIIGVVHFSGGSNTGPALTEKMVEDRFQEDLPNETVVSVLMSDDRKFALLNLKDSTKMGVVKSMGSMIVTRLLDANSLKKIAAEGNVLRLHMGDFTLRSVELVIEDEHRRDQMLKQLLTFKKAA